ncbi:DUF3343 domain-containing protein [Bacteroides heparinolyticus]|uniref:DUF3343 domain-containing protein n=1 Tax=Prevotella heparinolytica TaxID=28113 RepID=UPI00359F28FE
MVYIATFFSHFGAIRFKKEMDGKVENMVLMPVPRSVSSSCGTCVRFEYGGAFDVDVSGMEELDKIIEWK